jgi:photosystem II stability/assembly factor-like uncharacterized protein
MSAHLDFEKRKKFLKKIPMRVLTEGILIVALAGFMGAYFWTSYRGEGTQILIQEKKLSSRDDLFGIHRGSGGRAWAVGKNGLILHTNDGGRNWEKQTSGTARALSAVSFADHRVGFVVGSGGIILSTQDGGLSWKKMRSSGTGNYLLGVQALDETKACAVGAFGTFLSTSDEGTTWVKCNFSWEKLIPQIIEELFAGLEPNLNAVYFVTKEVGWIVGEFGLVMHTRDGGRNWTVQRSGSNLAPLFAVIFRDERRGWAMGQRGTLIWTKDGGQHWFPSKLETDEDLYAASFEGECMVVVGDRVFLKSEDGGSTWTRKDLAENLVLTGVVFMSEVPTVVGQGGVIRQVK